MYRPSFPMSWPSTDRLPRMIAYAWALAYQPHKGVTGFGWFIVILAFLADLSGYGLIGNRRQTAR